MIKSGNSQTKVAGMLNVHSTTIERLVAKAKLLGEFEVRLTLFLGICVLLLLANLFDFFNLFSFQVPKRKAGTNWTVED